MSDFSPGVCQVNSSSEGYYSNLVKEKFQLKKLLYFILYSNYSKNVFYFYMIRVGYHVTWDTSGGYIKLINSFTNHFHYGCLQDVACFSLCRSYNSMFRSGKGEL